MGASCPGDEERLRNWLLVRGTISKDEKEMLRGSLPVMGMWSLAMTGRGRIVLSVVVYYTTNTEPAWGTSVGLGHHGLGWLFQSLEFKRKIPRKISRIGLTCLNDINKTFIRWTRSPVTVVILFGMILATSIQHKFYCRGATVKHEQIILNRCISRSRRLYKQVFSVGKTWCSLTSRLGKTQDPRLLNVAIR